MAGYSISRDDLWTLYYAATAAYASAQIAAENNPESDFFRENLKNQNLACDLLWKKLCQMPMPEQHKPCSPEALMPGEHETCAP